MKVILLRVEVPDEWLNDENGIDPSDFIDAVRFGTTTELQLPPPMLRLSDQQLRDMCSTYGWDDSYQSIKAYRTVEAMSIRLNSPEQ